MIALWVPAGRSRLPWTGTAILGPVRAILALPFTAIVQSFAGTYLRRHDLIDEAEELEDHARAGTTAQARGG